MEKTTRRKFCGTALLALPALALLPKAKAMDINGSYNSSDPIFDSLADEFTRITADGAKNGFKSEHFRRYAGFMRVFDAQMENKGINRETDKKLDEDDFRKLDPMRSARAISDFWRRRKIEIHDDELIERLTMDWKSYRDWKKAFRKLGGIHVLHTKIAETFEQAAKAYETSAVRNGPFIDQGRIEFPPQEEKAIFLKAQYEDYDSMVRNLLFQESVIAIPFAGDVYAVASSIGFGVNYHCLCRAMVVEGAILSLVCLSAICLPCCTPAATVMAVEKLLEGLGLCSPNMC
jgi:hypothetical protein